MKNEVIDQLTHGGWWLNHFADLRTIYSSEDSLDQIKAQSNLLLELKILCIFWGENLLVEDGDLLNNIAFHKLFKDDLQYCRSLIDSGIIKIAVRDNISGLFELNELAKEKRTVPGNYDKVKTFCNFFDNRVNERRISTISWSVEETSQYYRETIKDFAFSINTPLMPTEHEILSDILRKSEDTFGNLHGGNLLYLARSMYGLANENNIVQAIRASRFARLKNASYSLILPPDDIDTSFVHFALNTNSVAKLSKEAIYECANILPKFIPETKTLQRLNFKQIQEIMSIGKDIGYYNQLRILVQNRGESIEEEYMKFLICLNKFLKEVEIGFNLEHSDWQKNIVNDYIKSKSDDAYKKLEILVTFIPISTLGAFFIAGNFISISKELLSLGGITSATSALSRYLIDKKRKKNKYDLDTILRSHKTI